MHWKKFFSYKFIAAEELDGKEITLTIIGVTTDEVYSPTARAKEKKAALKFKETDKMVILNATNARKITEILGSPQVETWTGKRITLYPLAGLRRQPGRKQCRTSNRSYMMMNRNPKP
jgi:hypothetical protein